MSSQTGILLKRNGFFDLFIFSLFCLIAEIILFSRGAYITIRNFLDKAGNVENMQWASINMEL